MSYVSDQEDESSCELGSSTGSCRIVSLQTFVGDSSENRLQFKANTGMEVIFVWSLHPFDLVTESSIFGQAVIVTVFMCVCMHRMI